MESDIAATARALIAQAEAISTEYERRAARWDADSELNYWRHEAEAWRQYADRLRAIAARHGLTEELDR